MKKFVFLLLFCFISFNFQVKAVEKLVLADFYTWYPWYGMFWYDWPDTQVLRPINDNGFVRQDAFRYKFGAPIPYLKSQERPNGLDDWDDTLAISWYKGNLSRAAGAGIDVLTPMARGDMGTYFYVKQLGNIIKAQKQLKAEGRDYPKLILHFDGIEYWDKGNGDNTNLSQNGPDFQALWLGTKNIFDYIFSNLSEREIRDYFYLYPDVDSFPIFVYRIEGGFKNVVTSDYWVTQLKNNFNNTYPSKNLHIILDDLWCNSTYGVNNSIVTKSCNGDDYYYWGGAISGARTAKYAKDILKIITVGPGFDNRTAAGSNLRVKDRLDGLWYKSQWDKAVSLGANWILIETFNFGEEGTAIDATVETDGFGNKYLNMTRDMSNAWKSRTNIVGDSNNDGVVDLLDFALWKMEYLRVRGTINSDFNGDGVVNLLDFALWKRGYLR